MSLDGLGPKIQGQVTITVTYAEALLNATAPEQLADHRPPARGKAAVTPEQMEKMEREMEKVQGQFRQVEQTYGTDLLHLTIAKGYLTRLLANAAVQRYLGQHQPEILNEFQALVDIDTIDPGSEPDAAVAEISDTTALAMIAAA